MTTLKSVEFNRGDLIFIVALLIFGLYSVLTLKRPQIHGLSFVAFTFGCGAICLVPFLVWEMLTRPAVEFNTHNLLMLFYVAVFPSHDRLSLLLSRRAIDRRLTGPRRSFMSCRCSAR